MESDLCLTHKLEKDYICEKCSSIMCPGCACVHLIEKHEVSIVKSVKVVVKKKKEDFLAQKVKIDAIQNQLQKSQQELIDCIAQINDESIFNEICKKYQEQFYRTIEEAKKNRGKLSIELINIREQIAKLWKMQDFQLKNKIKEMENMDTLSNIDLHKLYLQNAEQNQDETFMKNYSENANILRVNANQALKRIKEILGTEAKYFEGSLAEFMAEITTSLKSNMMNQLDNASEKLVNGSLISFSRGFEKLKEFKAKMDCQGVEIEQTKSNIEKVNNEVTLITKEGAELKETIVIAKANLMNIAKVIKEKKEELGKLSELAENMKPTICVNGCKKRACVTCGEYCSICKTFCCNKCIKKCNECQNLFCKICFEKIIGECSKCNSFVCRSCLKECNKCKGIFCKECETTCIKCEEMQ